MEEVGRKERYVIEPDSKETSLSLGIDAAKKALKNANLLGNEIDMICFCSSTPEYFCPPCALLVHEAISGNDHAFCYD